MRFCVGLGILLAVGLTARPAQAVIEVLMPLSQVIKDSASICVAKVEKLDPEKPSVVLRVVETLKGKLEVERLPVNLKGEKPVESQQLVERLAEDLPVVLFAIKPEGDTRTLLFGYTNGTWFQIIGHADGAQIRWAYSHTEPFLTRTYNSSTAELRAVLADAIAGKKPAPRPNPKEKPGLGPTVAEATGKEATNK